MIELSADFPTLATSAAVRFQPQQPLPLTIMLSNWSKHDLTPCDKEETFLNHLKEEVGSGAYLEADRERRSRPEVHKVLAAVAQCLS